MTVSSNEPAPTCTKIQWTKNLPSKPSMIVFTSLHDTRGPKCFSCEPYKLFYRDWSSLAFLPPIKTPHPVNEFWSHSTRQTSSTQFSSLERRSGPSASFLPRSAIERGHLKTSLCVRIFVDVRESKRWIPGETEEQLSS